MVGGRARPLPSLCFRGRRLGRGLALSFSRRPPRDCRVGDQGRQRATRTCLFPEPPCWERTTATTPPARMGRQQKRALFGWDKNRENSEIPIVLPLLSAIDELNFGFVSACGEFALHSSARCGEPREFAASSRDLQASPRFGDSGREPNLTLRQGEALAASGLSALKHSRKRSSTQNAAAGLRQG